MEPGDIMLMQMKEFWFRHFFFLLLTPQQIKRRDESENLYVKTKFSHSSQHIYQIELHSFKETNKRQNFQNQIDQNRHRDRKN